MRLTTARIHLQYIQPRAVYSCLCSENRFKPIAIVVPADATLTKFAVDKGLAGPDYSLGTLVDDSRVVDAVYAELLAVGKRGGLVGTELIQGLVLVSEEWTAENVEGCHVGRTQQDQSLLYACLTMMMSCLYLNTSHVVRVMPLHSSLLQKRSPS